MHLSFTVSATKVTGLVNTTAGIRYSDDDSYAQSDTIPAASAEEGFDQSNDPVDGSVLTRRSDKGKITDFCYLLMSQFGPDMSRTDIVAREGWSADMSVAETSIAESSVVGMSVPSIAVSCRFCRSKSTGGKQLKGVFLSSKADTMARNKNLARMYNHVLACAPEDLKSRLIQAKNIHLPQSDRLKKGWKKRFFETICERLHAALDVGQTTDAASQSTVGDGAKKDEVTQAMR